MTACSIRFRYGVNIGTGAGRTRRVVAEQLPPERVAQVGETGEPEMARVPLQHGYQHREKLVSDGAPALAVPNVAAAGQGCRGRAECRRRRDPLAERRPGEPAPGPAEHPGDPSLHQEKERQHAQRAGNRDRPQWSDAGGRMPSGLLILVSRPCHWIPV